MDHESYSARSKTITLSLITTGMSLLPTAYVALISNSLTLFTDLLRCSVEFLAILVAYLVTRQTRPENIKRYNYGFGKLEHLSSLTVGATMVVAFLVASFAAIQRMIAPEPVTNAQLGLYLAILSVLGNIYIWHRNTSLLKHTSSPVSMAQAKLFLSKTIACLVVAISLFASIYLKDSAIGLHADSIGSLAVACFLLYSSYHMIFHSLGEMLDASLEESAQLLILKTLVKFESDYINLSQIRTRRAGDKNYVELWLEFEKTLTLDSIYSTTKKISQEIEKQIPSSEVLIIPTPA